jgi:hypothetical protein
MLGTCVAAAVKVVVTEIPRGARRDRSAAANADRKPGGDKRRQALAEILMPGAVAPLGGARALALALLGALSRPTHLSGANISRD